MVEHRLRVCEDDLPVVLTNVRGVPARALEVMQRELVRQLVSRVAMRDYSEPNMQSDNFEDGD